MKDGDKKSLGGIAQFTSGIEQGRLRCQLGRCWISLQGQRLYQCNGTSGETVKLVWITILKQNNYSRYPDLWLCRFLFRLISLHRDERPESHSASLLATKVYFPGHFTGQRDKLMAPLSKPNVPVHFLAFKHHWSKKYFKEKSLAKNEMFLCSETCKTAWNNGLDKSF